MNNNTNNPNDLFAPIDGTNNSNKFFVTDNSASNTDINYLNSQKYIIQNNNDQLYKKIQHDNPITLLQKDDNLTIHGDKGFDYRDFPVKNVEFDPYIDYLHKHGLIGKKKSYYNTEYAFINSEHRVREHDTIDNIPLDNNPLMFVGNELRLYTNDTSKFELNDAIIIDGLIDSTKIFRSRTIDNNGDNYDTFIFEKNRHYITVNAGINMDINSDLMSNIVEHYNDLTVMFQNFKGDIMTEWYFNVKQYNFNIKNNDDMNYEFVLSENVLAYDAKSFPDAIPTDLIIAKFVINQLGLVIEIDTNFFYNAFDIAWLVDGTNVSQSKQNIPHEYLNMINSSLQSANLKCPKLPTSIFNTLYFFQNMQNIVRPIFYDVMKNVPYFISAYAKANKSYNCNVQIIMPNHTNIIKTDMFGNIPLNRLNCTHKMYLTENNVNKSINDNMIDSNKFYIVLDRPYEDKYIEIYNPLNSSILKIITYEHSKFDVDISYNHYGGIITKNISHKILYVDSIVKNKFLVIKMDKIGLYNKRFGGDTVYISFVNESSQKKSLPNKYVIDLEKTYSNVVMVKMVGSMFLNTHKTISNNYIDGSKNSSFYWQNIDDGSTLYKIDIPSGFYNSKTLKNVLEDLIKNVYRIKNQIKTNIRNYMIFDIDTLTDIVVIKSYNEYIPYNTSTNIINNFSCPFVNYAFIKSLNENVFQISDLPSNDQWYYYPDGKYYQLFPSMCHDSSCIRVRIYHVNHNLKVHDTIRIEGSSDYGPIPANQINREHIVTQIINNNTYDIVVSDSNINSNDSTTGTVNTNNINNVKIYTPLKFRLRFDFDDSIGKVLGFRNIGDPNSITPYQSIINNDVVYINETIDSHNIRNHLSFCTNPYLIISCKELNHYNIPGPIKKAFYIIQLPNKYGEYAFDTYIDTPIFYNQPLHRLNKLSIEILSPNGKLYDSIHDHTFALQIITYDESPKDTNLCK